MIFIRKKFIQILHRKSIDVNKKKIKFQLIFLFFIFLDESRISSNSSNGIYSHKASISNSDIIESTSEANSGSQNRYTGRSNTSNSRSHTPVVTPTLNKFDLTNGNHEHLIDNGKGSSLLTGTSFDVLMNNLKGMREKDLDFLIDNSDDSLIRVTD
jgi:hypothetical protein